MRMNVDPNVLFAVISFLLFVMADVVDEKKPRNTHSARAIVTVIFVFVLVIAGVFSIISWGR